MKEELKYKNYICFILAILMLIMGICLRESQMDSSFALRQYEPACITLDKESPVQPYTAYAAKEAGTQDAINNGVGRIDIQKLLKQGRTYDRNASVMDRQHAIVHYLQELDIRLCRTDNLTSVFTVIYIHHQDGVKRQGTCFRTQYYT